ncbi:MAG: hypothetical protein IJU81_05590 [Bacteroidales bacterium]|nr:hypothetical protein [Bacteroidales bacterium]
MGNNTDFPMIRRARTTVAGNLGVDFGSRRTEDYVSVLNLAAKAVGAVPNMGVYADINNITYHPMLKVETTEHYIKVDTHNVESPRKSKTRKSNISTIGQLNLDTLAGDIGKKVEGILDGTIENHQCSPTEVCIECRGTGHCRECDGTKHHKCNMCHGSGDCHVCNGDGIVECDVCRGLGDCPYCHGTGLSDETCPQCGGSGKTTDPETHRKAKCPTCNGHGVMPCPRCATSGNKKPGKCPMCLGKGEIQCSACNGKGKCHVCNGKGHTQCNTCNGTGKCNMCNGTGNLKCPRCEGSGWYQTYTAYTAEHSTKQETWVSSRNYEKLLLQAQGRSLFSGRLKKWQKDNILEYDHTNRLHASVDSVGGNIGVLDEFLADHEKGIKKKYGIRYAMEAEVTFVPAVRIDFVLEQVPHSMVILGHNGVMAYDSLPGKLAQYRVGLFKRIGMTFNRRQRHMEYIRLAAYIFQTDGHALEESRLLNAFVRQLGYRPAKTKRLLKDLEIYDNDMDYPELREEIKHLLASRRVLTFAWHCMERDGRVSEREQKLWHQLVAEFDMSESELEPLKRNAARYALLSDEEIVEEYLRK